MGATRNGLRWFVGITGPLVLVSYVVGIARAEDPEALWGGIGPEERLLVVPFMFLAAAGFLAYAWFVLYKWDDETVASLSWWRQASDGNGIQRLMWAYGLYLVPSALWLEATLLHLRFDAAWTQALTIGVLFLVGVGVVMLGLLACSAMIRHVPGGRWMVAGTVAMGIQSILNDLVIWVWRFPW